MFNIPFFTYLFIVASILFRLYSFIIFIILSVHYIPIVFQDFPKKVLCSPLVNGGFPWADFILVMRQEHEQEPWTRLVSVVQEANKHGTCSWIMEFLATLCRYQVCVCMYFGYACFDVIQGTCSCGILYTFVLDMTSCQFKYYNDIICKGCSS